MKIITERQFKKEWDASRQNFGGHHSEVLRSGLTTVYEFRLVKFLTGDRIIDPHIFYIKNEECRRIQYYRAKDIIKNQHHNISTIEMLGRIKPYRIVPI